MRLADFGSLFQSLRRFGGLLANIMTSSSGTLSQLVSGGV
jgi:hypothetical protein